MVLHRLRHDQSLRGKRQFNNALIGVVIVFTGLSLLIGWWAASRVMSPVSELAQRLRGSGSIATRGAGDAFPDDEVGELAKALDDYSSRLTEVVKRDREFNADVSHELRTPLAVIKGAVEHRCRGPTSTTRPATACSASSARKRSAPT